MGRKKYKQSFIDRFEEVIDNYDNIQKDSPLPWFFDGSPGKQGLQRLAQAKGLLKTLKAQALSDDEALCKVCKLYLEFCDKLTWRSRLVDGIGHLLDDEFGTQWVVPVTTSAAAVMRQVQEHDEARLEAINSFIKHHESPHQETLASTYRPKPTRDGLVRKLTKVINDYDRIPKGSFIPWFLGGSPGRPGRARLNKAKALVMSLQAQALSDEEALYRLCKF